MGRLILLMVVSLLPSPVLGADLIPAPESPTSPSQPPAEQPKPEATPPATDPGMVKQPETIPDPNSVVNPPVVDPKMAINPEAAPPQSIEPSERQGHDQPSKKQ
jgi:hypothetical protein